MPGQCFVARPKRRLGSWNPELLWDKGFEGKIKFMGIAALEIGGGTAWCDGRWNTSLEIESGKLHFNCGLELLQKTNP